MVHGVLHVHSVFSDGEESLERLSELLSSSGLNFMAISDHAEAFDDERMTRYLEACAKLSNESFTIIPGLEFASRTGLHILGYGVKERFQAKTVEEIVDGIHRAGGVAVLAHPPAGCINVIAAIKHKLDGVEIWNGRYDGVRSPRARSFQVLRWLRSANPNASAYGGVDLHKRNQVDKPITVEVDVDAKELDLRQGILSALLCGRFCVKGGSYRIPANGDLTFAQELSIAVKQPLCKPWAR